VLIDILTPKQAFFFSKLRKELERRGHEVRLVTRERYGGKEGADLLGLEVAVVGRHGGRELEGKLVSSLKRSLSLVDLVLKEKIDFCTSFSSPETARVAFGLGIPHFCFNDSPHSEKVARLTVPLSSLLFTPWVIPYRVWLKFGISKQRIVKYRSLDQAFWLRDWKYRDELHRLGLERRKTAVVRLEEEKASYLMDYDRRGLRNALGALVKELEGWNVVILPRYPEQAQDLEGRYRGAVVLKEFIDGPSLLSQADLFVGMGGTMTTEAALLGVPTLSLYPGRTTLIERFMIRRNLVVKAGSFSPNEVKRALAKLLSEDYKRQLKKRVEALWREMEDPLPKILEAMEKYMAERKRSCAA